MRYHIINGQVKESEQATISHRDIGLLRGYGIFDFFPIHQGRAVFEIDYFDRFYSSAQSIGLTVPIDRSELRDQILMLTQRNGSPNGYIRLVLTGGDSPNGYTPVDPNLLIAQYGEITYQDEYNVGIHLLLQRFLRGAPEVKSLNYANAISQRQILEEAEAVDFLYHDGRVVSETSRANFFIVDAHGVLRTHHDTILKGITRGKVLQIAAKEMDTALAPLKLSDVARAKEAFITSTTKGIMPVTKLDRRPVGSGQVGDVTQRLSKMFWDYRAEYLANL